ncbi:Restriction endonuclease BglII [uncultured Ruminococcus sp.]|nr:Restriction endonuclease BglII [uncultured Ruminococcus sp.]
MRFVEYSHRHADAIIAHDSHLKERYTQFVDVLKSISDDELIEDFIKRKDEHKTRKTAFKSMTPSINGLIKERLNDIPGWKAEVDIFNDETGVITNTEWRLDFACDDAFCVEVAFNHGEAIAWNLLKPVLSCELNHVKKAIQGQIGIYVCATDNMKHASNIDSSSGSYEKVLRYLQPMMNQLTIPMMIIGLEPFETFKIGANAEIIRTNTILKKALINHKVEITKMDDYSTYTGTVIDIDDTFFEGKREKKITIQKTKNNSQQFTERAIRFLEVLR